ncbi:unnamed protein product [Vitrella brassicaformis CCMP3155]|uniref:Helicase ATP-binding domain-containing protein n=1 Tax=Vitrella brassicaformis (strain CCMP3155) TaxID=1169540 RepID=A0A0G4ENT0_VITBC|nr:unnamed protein product [Vitrella brassicaformis CCMP3155]|eukprot:CEL98682.1 unnamed protein product [Vitrella brassicaformis CCMP3155]
MDREQSTHSPSRMNAPRDYQLWLFDRVKRDNSIVFMPTNTGKTRIATLLIDHVLNQPECASNIIVFLAPTKPLGAQQEAVIELETRAGPVLIHGDVRLVGPDSDNWDDPLTWDRLFYDLEGNAATPFTSVGVDQDTLKSFRTSWMDDAQQTAAAEDASDVYSSVCGPPRVFVMTPAKMVELLHPGMIRLDRVALMVLDECHHVKGGDMYSSIMRNFYDRVPVKDRPHILGLTAYPSKGKANAYEAMAQDEIHAIERVLCARLIVPPAALLEPFCPSVTEEQLRYDVPPPDSHADWQSVLDNQLWAPLFATEIPAAFDRQDKEALAHLNPSLTADQWIEKAKEHVTKRLEGVKGNVSVVLTDVGIRGVVNGLTVVAQKGGIMVADDEDQSSDASGPARKKQKLPPDAGAPPDLLQEIYQLPLQLLTTALQPRPTGAALVAPPDAPGPSPVLSDHMMDLLLTPKVKLLRETILDALEPFRVAGAGDFQLYGDSAGSTTAIRHYSAAVHQLKVLVFVERRLAAVALKAVLQETLRGPDGRGLTVEVVMGTNASAAGNPGKVEFDAKAQDAIMGRFRDTTAAGIQVLISTSVLEEGIDVPLCNCVVRFSPVVTGKENVQCRGRARKAGSRYIHLIPNSQDGIAIRHRLASYQRFETLLREQAKANQEAAMRGEGGAVGAGRAVESPYVTVDDVEREAGVRPLFVPATGAYVPPDRGFVKDKLYKLYHAYNPLSGKYESVYGIMVLEKEKETLSYDPSTHTATLTLPAFK